MCCAGLPLTTNEAPYLLMLVVRTMRSSRMHISKLMGAYTSCKTEITTLINKSCTLGKLSCETLPWMSDLGIDSYALTQARFGDGVGSYLVTCVSHAPCKYNLCLSFVDMPSTS